MRRMTIRNYRACYKVPNKCCIDYMKVVLLYSIQKGTYDESIIF